MIDENFFDTWSENVAYLLGYIAADGCLIKRKGRKNSYTLAITSKDKDHLEKISSVLRSKYKISTKFNGMGKIAFFIQISSNKVCHDMLRLGIFPLKTLTLKPIFIPEEYFKDFVRGYFDADGSVYIYLVNGTPQIKAEIGGASLEFIEFLCLNACRDLDIPTKPIHKFRGKAKNSPIYSFVFYVANCVQLFDYFYSHNPQLYMSRKRQIFLDWQKVTRRKYTRKIPAST